VKTKDLSNILTRIGSILYKEYKLDETLRVFQCVLKIEEIKQTADQQNILKSLSKMGLILNNQEKYNEALKYFQN
jgi:hypothetical protein